MDNKKQRTRILSSSSFKSNNTGASKKSNIIPDLTKKKPFNKEIDKEKVYELQNELNNIMKELSTTREETKKYKDLISSLFNKSASKETELKGYLSKLNNKIANFKLPNENLEVKHNQILKMIEEIQNKIKIEILNTKKEMESEIISKFQVVEKQQQIMMGEKIDEQKRVIDKVSNTRSEIEKIRKNFEKINNDYELFSKENEALRVKLLTLKEDNQNLSSKIDEVKKRYINILKENGKILKDDIDYLDLLTDNVNIEELDYLTSDEDREKDFISQPESLKNSISVTKSKNSNNDLNIEDIIYSLKKSINDTKIEYNNLNTQYIKEIKKKNESQQLLQKCIEDLKFDINRLNREIILLSKNNFNQNQQEHIQAKKTYLNELEGKLKIMTFVYDNGFQNTKKKNLQIR